MSDPAKTGTTPAPLQSSLAMSGLGVYNPPDKLNLSTLDKMERFGISGEPLVATEAYVAPITRFSKKNTRAEKWVLVNGAADPPTMAFINTYDGKAGAGLNAADFTFPLDPKRLRQKISAEHKQVPVEDCPVAIPAGTPGAEKLAKVQSVPDGITEEQQESAMAAESAK